MGFRYRKSTRVGPFRFTLSKSGVNVSTGIKGLRVGSGPRGNYVSVSGKGFSYKTTIPKDQSHLNSETKNLPDAPPTPETINNQPEIYQSDKLQEIDSKDIAEMQDISAKSLLEEINRKKSNVALLPATLFACVLLLLFSMGNIYFFAISIIISLTLCRLAKQRDALKKTVVLFYDFDESKEHLYKQLYEAFENLQSANKIWHIAAAGDVKDRKRSAGADTLVKRNPISIKLKQPKNLKINIDVPCIPVGVQELYLLPDTILIFDRGKVGAAGYTELSVHLERNGFIETDKVPIDSKVIDETWRYVNKKGGPDKRFKDNCRIPIAEYGDLSFRSESGLNELIQISNVELAKQFKLVIENYCAFLKD